jgi:hypothetical protein
MKLKGDKTEQASSFPRIYPYSSSYSAPISKTTPSFKIPTLSITGDRAMHRRMAAEEAIYAHRYQHPS